MTKQEKLQEVKSLLNMAFNRTMDLKDETRSTLKAILKAEGVDDPADIKDFELYKVASDLVFNGDELSRQAEGINDIIELLDRLDLSKI